MENNNIGIFDSGIGGITVLKEIVKVLPNYNYIYYSDSKNNPYGDKSDEEIISICDNVVKYLLDKGCKTIVIACNTASAKAATFLRNKYKNIIFVAIEPAYKMVFDYAYNDSTLVMATKATIESEKFNMLYEKYNNNLSNKIIKALANIDIKKPTTILTKNFGYKINNDINGKNIAVASDVEEKENLEVKTKYIKDPNPTEVKEPRVYIYNTHQLENYSATNFEDYNITPNVLMASYMLKEKLNKNNIPTIVETSNINEFLNLNGWNYASSYKASRFYVLDALSKNNKLDLLIDLHRDAISKDKSTAQINGKNYAKVLFVVGLEHENYEANLELANKLNSLIKEKYPAISRGVITKQGAGVNGIYNQDLSPKSVLIECGGKENSIDEVMNTTEILTQIIKEYLGD